MKIINKPSIIVKKTFNHVHPINYIYSILWIGEIDSSRITIVITIKMLNYYLYWLHGLARYGKGNGINFMFKICAVRGQNAANLSAGRTGRLIQCGRAGLVHGAGHWQLYRAHIGQIRSGSQVVIWGNMVWKRWERQTGRYTNGQAERDRDR